MQRMLAGEMDTGHGRPPGPGLYQKFSDSLKDAIKKFLRLDIQLASEPNFVFFNLTGLDTPSLFRIEDVKGNLIEWADECERTILQAEGGMDVRLVICYGYQWKTPFRDCA